MVLVPTEAEALVQPDAAVLARLLAGHIITLTAELLPSGRREGAEWVHPSLSGTSKRSLSVRLTGPKAGVWSDFSRGEAGDALDLVARVRFAGDRKAAYAWSRDWLGLQPACATPTARAHCAAIAGADADQAVRKAKARALFQAAVEGLADTPVAAYLTSRGIDLAALGHPPRALRFHPAVWCQEVETKLPAMLAAITSSDGEHLATHRTWLTATAKGRWIKARLRNPKKTLGSYAGGFIPLQRGPSPEPLHRAPDGSVVAVAEGIETALSVAQACPELRILAAVSLANLARIVLPPTIQTVILCADNDSPDNHAAGRALAAAIDHFSSIARAVRLARPPVGKDFNDTIRNGACDDQIR